MGNTQSIPLSLEEMLGLQTAAQWGTPRFPAAHYSNGAIVAAGATTTAAALSAHTATQQKSPGSRGGIRSGDLVLFGGLLLLLIASVQYMKWQERKERERRKVASAGY